MDWLRQTLAHLNGRFVLIGLAIFVVTFVVSLALVSFLVVKLPATYFQESHDRSFWPERSQFVRWGGIILKNLLGLILVALGILMSLPGVPGQGVLTILLGVMLMDFPGKRRLEYWIVSQPKIFNAINRLRKKFEKPPLVLDS